jgi:hypothetical protein
MNELSAESFCFIVLVDINLWPIPSICSMCFSKKKGSDQEDWGLDLVDCFYISYRGRLTRSIIDRNFVRFIYVAAIVKDG